MDLVKTLTEQYMKPELPQMNVGDTVRVTVRVKEGNRVRNQAFDGTIIAKKHGGINETITRCTLPPSSPSRRSAAARSAARSSITCATAWARRPRSRSASELRSKAKPAAQAAGFCCRGFYFL